MQGNLGSKLRFLRRHLAGRSGIVTEFAAWLGSAAVLTCGQ
jgi:hypothetical protein